MSAGPWIEWFPTVISCKATIDNLPCSACAVRCRGVGVLVRKVRLHGHGAGVSLFERPDDVCHVLLPHEGFEAHRRKMSFMSKLANQLYNLSMIASGHASQSDRPLPGSIDFGSFGPEGQGVMGDLVLERFGVACHDHLTECGGGIGQLVKALDSLPQVVTPKTIVSFRESDDPRSGMVIFFPGRHGAVRSFHNFASLIDTRNSVLGIEYDGLDRDSKPASSMRDAIEKMYRDLVGSHAERLDRLQSSRRELVLFGFCLGSCYAHALARRISLDYDLQIRMVFFDGHPAEWFRDTTPRDLLRKPKNALKVVRGKGDLDRRLVRQGQRQHHILSRHASLPVDHPALLILSNWVGDSWSLCSEAWQPLVCECRQITYSDLSHMDLMQRRQEFRIVEHVQPG